MVLVRFPTTNVSPLENEKTQKKSNPPSEGVGEEGGGGGVVVGGWGSCTEILCIQARYRFDKVSKNIA